MRKIVESERGAVLVAIMLSAIMLTAFFLVFSNWASIGSKSVTHSVAIQKATYSAESGYYAALDWVKTPAANDVKAEPYYLRSLTQDATYQLTLQRSTINDKLVVIISTGYFPSPTGPVLDPLGQRAFSAVVEAKVRLEVIRDYFAVVPGKLQIAYGSNLELGKVYGNELIFEKGPQGPGQTKVEGAFYFTSVRSEPPGNPLNFITYGAGGLTQLPTELGAPRVAVMSEYYFKVATQGVPCVLPKVGNECPLSGVWTPPANPSKVCYCEGDLVLGAGMPLTMNGTTVIYSEGNTRIENSILANDPPNDWLAVVGIQGVTIAESAPNNLTINGTFVTDEGMSMLGGDRPGSVLTFKGGIVSQLTPALGGYAVRNYVYEGGDPELRLPFLVQSIGWSIRKHYSH